MMFIKRASIMLAVLLYALNVNAAESRKISLAIMDFRANNTKEGFAKACMDMLSERLFSSGLFTLMEKSQMDRIARANGFSEFDTANPLQVARLGRVLKVDKMISGSITFIDSYIIEVRVLNAATGEIEFNTRKNISSIDKLEPAIDDISLSIERHSTGYYNLSGNFDITIEGHYIYPFGDLGDAVDPGAGAELIARINSPLELPLDMQLVTGFFSFKPRNESMNYFCSVPVYFMLSRKIDLSRNLSLVPAAGGGYLFTKVSSDEPADGRDLYWSERSLYYNPAIVLRGEIDIFLMDRWYLAVTPQYNIFFEDERTGRFASLGLGIKMLF